jgi:hypothetical protein
MLKKRPGIATFEFEEGRHCSIAGQRAELPIPTPASEGMNPGMAYSSAALRETARDAPGHRPPADLLNVA